jgi:hypothetical protein
MMSNSDCAETTSIYGDHLELFQVAVRQSNGRRGSHVVQEIIGINYEVSEMADPAAFLNHATPI